jgi:hypothetical protein
MGETLKAPGGCSLTGPSTLRSGMCTLLPSRPTEFVVMLAYRRHSFGKRRTVSRALSESDVALASVDISEMLAGVSRVAESSPPWQVPAGEWVRNGNLNARLNEVNWDARFVIVPFHGAQSAPRHRLSVH